MWINPKTSEIFILHSDIRSAFPSVSFPFDMSEDDIASVGVLPVSQISPPAFDRLTQKLSDAVPALVNGTWTQQWEVTSLSTDEQKVVIDQIRSEIVADTQSHLDDFARTRTYDGILSLCTYATSTNPTFAKEGQYGVNIRDATWTKLYEVLAEVEAGTRPAPTGYVDIESELPILDWSNII